jgi:hypothetical protein
MTSVGRSPNELMMPAGALGAASVRTHDGVADFAEDEHRADEDRDLRVLVTRAKTFAPRGPLAAVATGAVAGMDPGGRDAKAATCAAPPWARANL